MIELLTENPRKRFDIAESGYSVWDLDAEYRIDPETFLSKGRATPFKDWEVCGKCLLTVYNNKVVYIEE